MRSRLVVMASGSGSTFEALVTSAHEGRLKAEVVGLVVSREGAGAIERAKRLNIPFVVVDASKFSSVAEWDQALLSAAKSFQPNWIILAGFMRKIGAKFLSGFKDRIVNIHPSLLPKHGGQGMYGRKVHEAVIAARETRTGVTVHLVDDQYDHGTMLAQKEVQVLPGDTPQSLEERVKTVEKDFYPKVLNLIVHSTALPL